MSSSNWLELNLSPEDDKFVRRYGELYRAQYVETIDTVFGIARSIDILKQQFDRSGNRGAFGDALVQFGFIARDGGPMNKAIRSFHKTLLDNEAAVRAWWTTVPEIKKRDWLSGKAICTNWKTSLRPPAPPQPKPSPHVAATNTAPNHAAAKAEPVTDTAHKELEAVRLENKQLREQLAAAAKAAEARIREMEDRVALAEIAAGWLPKHTDEFVARRRVVAEIRKKEMAATKAARDEARAQQAAAALAQPGAPDAVTLMAENETLKQQLKALRIRVRNMKEHAQERQGKTGVMSFQTASAIAKCIFPDQRNNATEADKDEACKQFTAWKADSNKARRARVEPTA
jgi:regulator of replication initiation timing